MKGIKYLIIAFALFGLVGCHHEDPVLYLAGDKPNIAVKDENHQEVLLPRGQEVYLQSKNQKEKTSKVYTIENETKIFYQVNDDQVVDDYQHVVTTPTVTANVLVNLRKEKYEDISDAYVARGETLMVDHVNMERDFNKDGTVKGYMVQKDGEVYYLDSFYLQEEINNKNDIYYGTFYDYWDGDGASKKAYLDDLSYLPVSHEDFANKPLNKDVHAVHVGLTVAYEEKDYLMQLCRETGIDTLVIEIKADDGRMIFESDTAKQYLSDTQAAFIHALTKEAFSDLLQTYHEQGIYLIGRVVTFKDPNFAASYPNDCIAYRDGSLYVHNAMQWPSPYSRNAWRYTLGFCKEAAELGIDEIQFDYVRFPDGIGTLESQDLLNLRNQYGETKPQAIQNFLYYARDELHQQECYLSADVFGWNMICGDDQNIGQFIPNMAHIVDAISPMPYPDHFGEYSLGIAKPWQEPENLLEAFTETSMDILDTLEKHAIFRSWIQGYPCLEWVCTGKDDNPYRGYGADEIIAQINGIRNAGQTGYIIWSGDGGKDMFEWRKKGFIE